MNSSRFILYIFSIILSGIYFLSAVVAVSADYTNSHHYYSKNTHSINNSKKNKDIKNKNNPTNFCSIHPTDPTCCPPIAVPEFGLFPGITAAALSFTTYIFIRKKYIG